MDRLIKTERLEIKPYSDSDLSAMIELLTNKEVKATYILPDFRDEREAASMFVKLKDYSYSDNHYERGVYLDKRLIGFVNDVEIEGKTIELGYVIHPDKKGKGYATEALKAVIDDLFDRGFNRIVTAAFEDNAASFRVMQKCGMQKNSRESDIFYRGELRHCLYCEIRR